VRHAEKAAEPVTDPVLTAVGEARARALDDALSTAHIGAIITTQYARARATAAPLAARLGLPVETVANSGARAGQSAADALQSHIDAVVAAIRKHTGAVLVVGHSNTIPAIATALGAPKMPDLCDGDYDQIFFIELSATGPARFVRARYGSPASDAKCAAMK
jgi:broad specificity phosphatase PhoE